MSAVRKLGRGIGWVWRRVADLGTLHWLWPGGAAVIAAGLSLMEGVPLALLFVMAIGAFVLTLIAVILWRNHFRPSQQLATSGMPAGPTESPKRRASEDAAEEEIGRLTRLAIGGYVAQPAPPPPTDRDGFDYPYPKAVMQAGIKNERGTKEALAGKDPHRLTIVLTVENKHKKTLWDCSVMVVGLVGPDGEEISLNLPLLNGERFNLDTKSPRNLPLLSRDMSDKITPQPFLLRTVGPGFPLKENSTYFAVIDLQCRYPNPTNLGLQIDTRDGLEARAIIVEQKVEQE